MARIHIVGASGTGTTTLGVALAAHLDHPRIDADTIFWRPTDPPFTTKRSVASRAALVAELLPVSGQWVFSGSAVGWAGPIEPFYDLIVFLQLDPSVRMERIRQREVARYGARVLPGGDMVETSAAFLDWAAAYDTAGLEQRSLLKHEKWLATQTAPVLRLDSAVTVEALVAAVLERR
ncbi:adenylate kinase [Reyranella sp.]|uniref:adenylate kinase n=1 Tax=Reyranella sp. TaxID=1929291 RepID=UPI0011F4B69B|nr:adenylate kinase [Reyranella sp.]TAJ88892.1 MAG: adenylate kinase [Reyranella sp.]